MKIFLTLLFICPFLLADDWQLPGQNPGNESNHLPGVNPDDTIFPTPATPASKAKMDPPQRPSQYGY